MSTYPLGKTTESDIRNLSQILWSWALCRNCVNNKPCTEQGCPSQRLKRLVRFFDYYKDITASYEPELSHGKQAALRSHEDLFEVVLALKASPGLTRAQLIEKLFTVQSRGDPIAVIDQEHAINLAVRVMLMVNCSAQRQSSGLLEHGGHQVRWRSHVTFSQFVEEIFPMTDHPGLNEDTIGSWSDMRSAITAKKLKKRAGLKFRPTDDLRSHLKLDRKNGTVEIYHHTAFLKEHLRITKDEARKLSVSDSLRLGALPRQLALETLDSLQKVLFPLSDSKSRSLLLSLTSTSSFDPDSLRFEFTAIRNTDEKDITYHYWGNRLVDLYEELQNPTARGPFEKWLERRSGARYVMFATLIGVVIAILLGMASLALGGYQAWVSYQQWQHPISSSG